MNKTTYPPEVKEVAIAMLDMGCAYATVVRALQGKFPEYARRIDHSVVTKWNTKYRDGKIPMMYMKHVDPAIFLDALDMAEEGMSLRKIAAEIKEKYHIKLSHGTIGCWIREHLPDTPRPKGIAHDAVWREKLRLASIRYAINSTSDSNALRRKLDKIKAAREIFNIQEALILRRLHALNEPVEWPEEALIVAP